LLYPARFQQLLQPRLAFAQRKRTKILAAGEQQIEREENEIAGLALGNCGLQRGKIRNALVIDGDDLAIDQASGSASPSLAMAGNLSVQSSPLRF